MLYTREWLTAQSYHHRGSGDKSAENLRLRLKKRLSWAAQPCGVEEEIKR